MRSVLQKALKLIYFLGKALTSQVGRFWTITWLQGWRLTNVYQPWYECHGCVDVLLVGTGCLQDTNPVICSIITSIINPGRAGASIINPGSAALARLRKWRSSDKRPFPTNQGDRRRGRCRATGRTGRAARPGPARGSFSGFFPGALRRGFFPSSVPGLSGGLGDGRGS